MAYYACRCTFVPPQVLENLARVGVGEARLSIQQSRQSRTKRGIRLVDMETFTGVKAKGKAARKVYDCKNTWKQRVKLVRDETDPPTGDEAVDQVHDHAKMVRDYFKNVLNRNSIDNRGMDLILNVHFGKDYMNAFWDGDEMTFGDGDGTLFVNFTKSLDVVAHELAHGVTQFTADLEYYSESGALNEHFSDVFGSAITQFALKQDAGSADWLIGNEIMGPQLYGETLRSMRAPGMAYNHPLMGRDPQPDHMENYYTGTGDNQGVHINSGIPNKAFYLVAMEIGTDKATLIWYDALQKLWSTAKFNDAVQVIVESARTLTKEGEVPLGSTQRVRAAFKAVGLPK
ncbi:MAG: peptidase M4 family protein [Anaerolineales bacterium]|nr:peptidase M4 family protein [Anaerolineales bacterium]